MIHRRAARLLSALLDGGLDPGTRRAIQAHVREGAPCRRRLRDHEAVEALVRLLPPALLPIDPSPVAQVRLWGLARWFVDPVAQARERLGLSAVGILALGLATVFMVTVSAWCPFDQDSSGLLLLAQAPPDVASMLPLGWR